MKRRFISRVLVLVLTLCLTLTMLPMGLHVADVEAVSGVNSLTCAGFISNSTARSYIDTMMKYYINSSSTLQSTLNNGNSVVFMFEGGSDNYWSGTTYYNGAYNTRTQAVCIVVKMNSSGNAYIAYYCENSSSIPSEPTWCTNGVAYSGSTTLMDGTYSFFTWNHTGPYAAFQINLTNSNGLCYYTPSANLNGYKAGASGINIHTRSTSYGGGSALGWAWSEGCQVIGYGNDSSNEFNGFMKAVTGISWNPWISWTNKTLNTWTSAQLYAYKGYYVVDRQLALSNPSGVKYGTGSLGSLYNSTALTNITANSTAARNAAGATVVDYLSKCTSYPAYGKLVCTGTDVWTRTLPCYASTDSSTVAIAQYNSGDELTCIGLVKNTEGEYWYKTLSSTGATVYVRAAYMDYKQELLTDIKLTGHTKPNGHIQGTGFVVDGTISTSYNQLTAVSAYIHDGLGTTGATETGHRETVSNNTYTLAGSAVDNNTWMNVMGNGPHTMAITAEYKNCYVENDTTLKTNTGKILLAEDYFMVIPSSVSQSTCSHTYQNYPVGTASISCTVTSKTVKGCTTCGLMGSVTNTVGSHSFGSWVTTAATCTKAGSKVRTCTACGATENETIPATEHTYTSKVTGANCQSLGQRVYTCTKCATSYTEAIESEYSDWSLTKPQGVDESLIETKTQYRYSDYKTFTSYNASESGYSQLSKTWEQSKTGSVYYVPSWPSGYDKTNSLYSKYNGTKTSASESANAKRVITYDGMSGFLYYHWCHSGSYYSYESKQGDYNVFHAYYSTTYPSNYECDTSDMSYKTSNTSCCTNSNWYFVTDVKVQMYTDYKALYTHGGYGAWSDWSDTPVTASDTRKVESRTMYRYVENTYGDHFYENNYCTFCGEREPDSNLYLFGFINGADYGCEADIENSGIYKFTDGVLTTKFTQDSYVAVKTGDNKSWYMTDGYPGDDATSAILYNTNKGINADKLFVPGGREVVFSLTDNGDDSFTLSYTVKKCFHEFHNTNGKCTDCGEEVQHTYVDGYCTVCSKEKPIYYLVGFINGADYGIGADSENIGEYKFVDGKLTVTFTHDSYVAFKTGDNSEWYNTDGYKGEEYTSANFYNAHKLGDNANKLFIPKGREIDFTLKDNGDGSFTLSYVAAQCDHESHDINRICTTCGDEVGHENENGVCTVCGYNCNHSFEGNVCTICGKEKPYYYLVGFINGTDYYSEGFRFEDNQLVTTFTDYSYLAVKSSDGITYMTNGYLGEGCTVANLYDSTQLGKNADKLYVPKGREVTATLKENSDGSLTLYLDIKVCKHKTHNLDGICTTCDAQVQHIKVDGVCTICGHICDHDFVNGYCKICSVKQPVYYLYGFIDGVQYNGDEYKFTNDKLAVEFTDVSYIAIKTADGNRFLTSSDAQGTSAQFYNVTTGKGTDMLYIPSGVELVFTLTCAQDGVITLSYEIKSCTHQKHSAEGFCLACGEAVTHTYKDGFCTVCGRSEPDYYLFGIINGENYACEDDAENMGIYKFSGGKLAAVFTQDSYVAVKTEGNEGWYMTQGYMEGETSATLYNTAKGIEDAQRLFVPKGRLITFTVVNNGDDTLTLSYVAAPCYHVSHNTAGECTTCGETVEHTYRNGICTGCSLKCQHHWDNGNCVVCESSCGHIFIDGGCLLCGAQCNHNFEDGLCTDCDMVCQHSFKDGSCTQCGTVCDHRFRNGVCKDCLFECTHSFEYGKCTQCNFICEHSFVDGECTTCGEECQHKYEDGKCTICSIVCTHTFENSVCTDCLYACTHKYTDGICNVCNDICEHSYSYGECTVCGVVCEHTYEDSVCTNCHNACGHSFSQGKCTDCGYSTQFYLVGYINGESIGCDENSALTGPYRFIDNTVSLEFTKDSMVAVKTEDNADWYLPDGSIVGTTVELCNTKLQDSTDMLHIPAGVKVTFTLAEGENGKLILSYELSDCQHINHRTDGLCSVCAEKVEHTYSEGECTICKKKETVYYLFGNINGSNYGCEEDSDTIGNYRFVDGKLTATFTQDSYVAVKSEDNMSWYMTDGDQGEVTETALYNTLVYGIDAQMLFVPGGVEITFALEVDSFDTLTLSYTTSEAKAQITPKLTRVSFSDGIAYEVCFNTKNMALVAYEDMGLAIFDSESATTPIQYVAGVYEDGRYLVASTEKINPKNGGDTVYFKVYARLSDGSYVYSDMMSENAVDYAKSVLKNPASSKERKAFMVALLNYCTEAQIYFNYKTDKLANAGLTTAEKALVRGYSADMMSKTVIADSAKTADFAKTADNALLYPTVSLDNAMFTVNYNCVAKDAQGEVTLYYWTQDAYNSADKLTAENATGTITMTMSANDTYTASISNIAPKDMDKTIYTSVVYTAKGETLCTGVVSYSLADYCKLYAEKNTSDIQDLAQAAIVYGYYAKSLFAET